MRYVLALAVAVEAETISDVNDDALAKALMTFPEVVGVSSIGPVKSDRPDTRHSALPEPPAHLADAWARYQRGEHIEGYEMSKLDEWRADCAQDAGF